MLELGPAGRRGLHGGGASHLVDVRSFLEAHPPFEELAPELLGRVVSATEIAFFPEGTTILDPASDPVGFAYVVRTGAVELLVDGRVVDLLGPGEMFGHASLLSGSHPILDVRAREDTLCYLIASDVVREVLASREGLAFLSTSLRRRVVRALGQSAAAGEDPWRTPVGELVRRPPVTCAGDTTVVEAAEIMTHERVSSLLVETGAGWGIVTDRDLRSRVISRRRDPGDPVADVMTPDAVVVGQDTVAAEALRRMLELGVHHLPVVGSSGSPLGMVTDTDLMGLQRRSPFVLRSEIERATEPGAAIEAFARLRAVVKALVDARVDPIDVGHVVGVTIDTLTARLLDLAIQELGAAPCAWAWMALGSQARHEQALATDQDHALIYEPYGARSEGADVDGYFARLAERVEAGLERAGIPRCRARVSATHRSWRRTVDEWAEGLRSSMRSVSEDGVVLSTIALDLRRVAGPLSVEERLNEVLEEAAAHPAFLQHLAGQALTLQPPTGFLRDVVVEARGEHAGTFDVKHGGILAITSLARVEALGVGSTERRTIPRLQAAVERGGLPGDDALALTESFRLLWQIRLEHQCSQVAAGVTPDDHVDPKGLGAVTRQGVKEAFRTIQRAQRGLALEAGLRLR
jgi:CBS domain-containing protein